MPLTAEHAASSAFIDSPQLVVFSREDNCTLCAPVLIAAAMLDEPLLNVTVAKCAPPRAGSGAHGSKTGGSASAAGGTTSPAQPAAQFAHDMYPTAEQGELAIKTQAAMDALMRQVQLLLWHPHTPLDPTLTPHGTPPHVRQVQRDAQWFGESDGEGADEAVAIARDTEEAARLQRRGLASEFATRRPLGMRLLHAVETSDDASALAALLDEAQALDQANRKIRMGPNSTATRTFDWQSDAPGAQCGLTALLLACRLGRLESATLLHARNATLTVAHPSLLSANGQLSALALDLARARSEALPWAVALDAGHVAVAQLLAPSFARAVHEASRGGRAFVPQLLRQCVDRMGGTEGCRFALDGRGADGASLVARASIRGDAQLVRELVELGASSNQATSGGLTPLMLAAMHCHIHVVKALLEVGAERHTPLVGPERARIKSKKGRSKPGGLKEIDASQLVGRYAPPCNGPGELEALQNMLDGTLEPHEAMPDLPVRRVQAAPTTKRRQQVAGGLLSPGDELLRLVAGMPHAAPKHAAGGADDDDDDDDETDKSKLARLLRERPFLLTYKSRQQAGRSPLHAAVSSGRVDAVEALLSHGAPSDVADSHGELPLMAAAQQLAPRLVGLLLAAGANVSSIAPVGLMQGRSALDVAVRARRLARAAHAVPSTTWDDAVRLLQDATAAAMASEMLRADAEGEVPASAAAVEKAEAEEAHDEPEEAGARAEAEEADEAAEQAEQAEGEPKQAGAEEKQAGAEEKQAGAEEKAQSDDEYVVCTAERLEWTPEVRLYGAGRGLCANGLLTLVPIETCADGPSISKLCGPSLYWQRARAVLAGSAVCG
jgi:hypothetical protein